MIPDWADKCYNILENPFAYCIHNNTLCPDSTSEYRKEHIHWLYEYPNTTTANCIRRIFDRLSYPGKHCVVMPKSSSNALQAYNYLIHDTEGCRIEGKELYDKKYRVEGNGFDIYRVLQHSEDYKEEVINSLEKFIQDFKITNFLKLNKALDSGVGNRYFAAYDMRVVTSVKRAYQSYYYKLMQGVYSEIQEQNEKKKDKQKNNS